MKLRIKKIIEKTRKVKYQRVLFTKKELDIREKTINLFLKLKKKKVKNKSCLSCDFYKKNLNNKNFINFYKKFNSNLLLKKKYNPKTYKKITNEEACFNGYLIFSKFLLNNKKINNLQKLNTLLKINDLLLIKFSITNHIHLIEEFKNLKIIEKKLIKKFL